MIQSNKGNESNKPTQEAVEAWLSTVTGSFYYLKACDGRWEKDKEEHPHLRMIFRRLWKRDDPLVEPIGNRDGWWRVIQQLNEPLTFDDDPTNFDIVLPFELNKYAIIPKESVFVVAGSKSAGKSGFLLRTAYLNKGKNIIILSNLEGGSHILRDRLLAMGLTVPFPFKIYHVTENHHDYIKESSSIYIIDYVDCRDGEFYKIGGYVQKISNKLQGLNSIAAVGLQKPEGREMPFGKDQTLKASFLTILLDKNILKIYDCKKAVDRTVNPNNMMWKFKYDEEGTQFTEITQWFGSSNVV